MIVCAQVHFDICKETGVKLDKEQWYEHAPKSVETSHEGKINTLGNQQVQTERASPRNTQHVECKNKSSTNSNRGKWNHLKIIQKITEPHTGKVRNKGTTENSHIAYCTLTSVSASVKVLNI